MPYIRSEDRVKFDRVIRNIPEFEDKGELEYLIYSIGMCYMEDKVYNYSNLHDLVYAFEHVAHEIKRRYLDNREDEAIKKNGDIL